MSISTVDSGANMKLGSNHVTNNLGIGHTKERGGHLIGHLGNR